MNLILLSPADLQHPDVVILRDVHRVDHIRQIHRAKSGDILRVGLLNGNMGLAEVCHVSPDRVELRLQALDTAPPPASGITIILGLPRPQMLKRTLQNISALGIKHLILLQSSRVEKSYWQTPQLTPDTLHHSLQLGLEQSCDTVMPRVDFAQRFRPFIEDELPALLHNTQALVAHPYVSTPCPYAQNGNTLLAIGPEGGFIAQEIDTLLELGFKGITLGRRILKVETAVPYLVGRLTP